MPNIKRTPAWLLRYIKKAFDYVRSFLFTKNVDDRGIDIVAFVSIEELRDELGDAYFTNGWELSYNYRGEDLNMRRPLRKDDTYEWYQTHVRAWGGEWTTRISVHEDLEPTQYPYYHLNPPDDAVFSQDDAIDAVAAVLDDAGIVYTVVDQKT